MALFTILTGVVLIILGLYSYFATGGVSITALIPAFFGVAFTLSGLLAMKEKFLKHAMHAAAVLALLGLVGSFGGILDVVALWGGADIERPDAAYSKAIMAIICVAFLGAAVRSFINARKEREAAE